MRYLSALVSGILFFLQLQAQQVFPYKNPTLPVQERVRDLLSRMTPEEKFWQLFMIPGDLSGMQPGQYNNGLFGFQVSAVSRADIASEQLMNYNVTESAQTLVRKVNAIQKHFIENTRLGIPLIIFDEALHGLVRADATSFPQSIGLAATWDTALMHRVAKEIAWQTRIRGIRQILSPVVNIASDVRWGRTEETYGEDPYLSSMMAIAYISELERAGIIATPKHFLANVGDGGRDSYPIHLNERLLREIHLPPFKASIDLAGARSIMTAYNSIDGSPATASNWLLNQMLKTEWGFKGFVISDASAVGGANVLHFTASDYPDASKKAIQNGLDVIFQTSYDHYKLFIPPFLNGDISKERIDDAVSRVLTAKFELGLFESPYVDSSLFAPHAAKPIKALAREAAEKSLVLLKNDKNLLPVGKNIQSIAVIGEEAVAGRLGGYSGPGNGVVNVLDGIRSRAGQKIRVQYAPGVGRVNKNWLTIPANCLFTDGTMKQPGVSSSFYKNISLSGDAALKKTDAQLDFNWTLYGPDNSLATNQYSLRWITTLKSPVTGLYKIGLEGNDGYRLYINNKLVIDNWVKKSYSRHTADVQLQQGKTYDLKVEFYETTGNAHIKLIWNVGVNNDWGRRIQQAVELARKSDMAIINVGITEGEFQDRAMLSLPGYQEEMIQKVAATGKPVVVILTGGSAITMQNWLGSVRSVIAAWYPGEEGGNAIASLLFGDISPAGRLPITYPLHEAQLPLVYNHKPTGRGDDYNNLSGSPLFPFGYGLSYSSFEYTDLKTDKTVFKNGDSLVVFCTVKNIGRMDADEVVQLYLKDELSPVARPVMELKGFQRIHIRKQESVQVRFVLPADAFRLYDEHMKWVSVPGGYSILIGSSSKEIKLQTTVTLQ